MWRLGRHLCLPQTPHQAVSLPIPDPHMLLMLDSSPLDPGQGTYPLFRLLAYIGIRTLELSYHPRSSRQGFRRALLLTILRCHLAPSLQSKPSGKDAKHTIRHELNLQSAAYALQYGSYQQALLL